MKPDEQLQQLLRDVPVPEGLHDRLMAIAEHQVAKVTPPMLQVRRSQWSRWTMLLATAAALGAIALWFSWPQREETNTVAQGENKNENKIENENPPVVAKVDLETLRANRERLEALEARIQLLSSGIRLRAAEKRLMATFSHLPTAALSSADRQSLTLFAANEAAQAWGARRETICNEMRALIEQFPDSKGAARAASFLTQNCEIETPNH